MHDPHWRRNKKSEFSPIHNPRLRHFGEAEGNGGDASAAIWAFARGAGCRASRLRGSTSHTTLSVRPPGLRSIKNSSVQTSSASSGTSRALKIIAQTTIFGANYQPRTRNRYVQARPRRLLFEVDGDDVAEGQIDEFSRRGLV